MKIKGKKRRGSLLMVLLGLAALLPACGMDAPTGQVTQTVSGVVTVQTATAGLKTCTGCHGPTTADWMLSKHANVNPIGNLYSQGNPTLGYLGYLTPADCVGCHDPQGDSAQLVAGYTGNTPRPVVGCEACHSGGKGHADSGGAGPIGFAVYTAGVISGAVSTVQVSAQFATCTSCHQLLDVLNDPANAATTTAAHDPGGVYALATANSITDTHFATPGSFTGLNGLNINNITGYFMDYSSESVCTDCHNPHRSADINRDWAESPHAEKTAAAAWAHYNWSCDGTSTAGGCGTTTPSSRKACERCHTTTGFSNYAGALQSGNAGQAEQIRAGLVTMITYSPGWKPEMLKCNGCHSDNRGALRRPGPYLATYSSTSMINTYHQFPDVNSSNVCILCHSGRTNGENIKTLNTDPSVTVDFSNYKVSSQFNGHHAVSAATMFRALGYEYDGRTYANPASYRHADIGSAAAPNTGASGPCVGCHMYRTGAPASHFFAAVSKSGEAVVSVSSEVCYTCHAGSSSQLAAVVENERLAFTYALAILNSQLTTTSQNGVRPKLTSATVNWLNSGDTDTSGNTSAKNNLGAIFNYNSLQGNEMAAYIHNSKYTKRLLYDSVDWLDDGVLNYSVGATLATYCSTSLPTCATGMTYLLPNGVRPGASSERPY